MNGFVKINKEKGISSFDVVKKIRKLTQIKKVGHSGTLDPMATGLLICALGSYTKKLGDFLGAPKSYEGELIFGKVSDTYDQEGQVKEIPFNRVLSLSEIEEKLPAFRGSIMQVPPIFSAKKIKGKKAYQLARKGEELVLEAQEKQIDAFEILDFRQGEFPSMTFSVTCSSGTYIRSLAHDLGQSLGVGAILSQLTRTQISDFKLEGALASETLTEQDITDALF